MINQVKNKLVSKSISKSRNIQQFWTQKKKEEQVPSEDSNLVLKPQGPKLTFLCERQVATEIFFSVARWEILVAKKCP